MSATSRRAQIRQVCSMGLSAEMLMPRLLPMLRELVPAESAGFFWVDGSGAMKNLYAERMLSTQKMQLYFDHYYEGGEFDFRRGFLQRAKSNEAVSSVPMSDNFRRSAYYNEILRELDAHHVLHGIVREHGAALGQLSLYRPSSAPAFSKHDRTELDSVLHYVAHAVAASPAGLAVDASNMGELIDTNDDAVAIVNCEGDILHASDAAKRLLIQAVDGHFSPNGISVISAPSATIGELLRQLTRRLLHEPLATPSITQDGRWGRIILRAYCLGEQDASGRADTPIAIRISRHEPMVLKFAHAMQALNLSPQMQEIALHLARGKSNLEIAESMSLAANTVTYHIKMLFQRLGTHSRDETVKQILSHSS